MKKENNKKPKREEEEEKENKKNEDYLNNVLTLDIIRLSSTLIKFDILRILDQTQNFALIIPDLIILFEYDKNFPSLSYCLSKIRGKYFCLILLLFLFFIPFFFLSILKRS